MPRTTFDHVGLLAGTTALARKCGRFYSELLGLQSVVPFGDTDKDDFCLLSDGMAAEKASLELIGQVFEERERTFYDLHGPGLDHLSFDTDDLDGAFESLSAAGVEIPIPPYSFLNTRLMCCKDPAGNDVKITQGAARAHTEVGDAKSKGLNAGLDHIGILVEDSEKAQEIEHFYKNNFGMRVRLRSDPRQGCMAWVTLEDCTCANSFFLQILGGAFLEHERAFLDSHGDGMHHLCFHVEDIDASRQVLRDRGIKSEIKTMEFGSRRMFFVRDPAGVMVQFIQAPGEAA